MKHEIVLPDDLAEFLKTLAAETRLTTVNDAVVRALYLLKDEFKRYRLQRDELRAEIQKGIDSIERGDWVDGEEHFDRLDKQLDQEEKDAAA